MRFGFSRPSGRFQQEEAADPLTVTGTGDADELTGDTGDDTIDGAGGDDILYGTRGSDVLIGGEGTDTADYSEGRGISFSIDGTVRQGRNSIDTLTEVEVIVGGEDGRNVINGHSDDEDSTLSIEVNLAKEALSILDASDDSEITYTVINFNNVRGTNHSDIIIGNDNDNRLSGAGGDDYLEGGLGTNRLFGGDGADSFVLGGGTDYIRDFDAQEGDQIFAQSNIADISDGNRGAVVTFEDNSTVTLIGYGAEDVLTDWFSISIV